MNLKMDILTCTPEEWNKNEGEWMELLKDNQIWNKVPLLNTNELHDLKDSRLVRFQGMVQDMHGPEFYMEKYEVVNENTKETIIKNGKYKDIMDCQENEKINIEGPNVVRSGRESYVVISIPAVNSWVTTLEKEQFKIRTGTGTSNGSSNKRPLDDEAMEVESSSSMENKRQNTGATKPGPSTVVSREHILNFPIPDSSGKVCHLKIYKDSDSVKLNGTYEFIGFLSVDPNLACRGDQDVEDMEFETHNPPPSLVPRIHCLSFRSITHNNPLIDVQNSISMEQMKFIKNELQIVLTQLLLGDEVAAEYLIYHLISGVYLRKDSMALGKFTLNISNIPILEECDFAQELYKFIELFVTKSHYLPMSLENMNELAFVPKKDYTCNRLTSSILQLSSNTHVLLDETKLSPGQLNPAGVNGIRAISNVIKNQKTTYDFTYYQLDFDCDIPFLILSEGKSIVPSDFHVPLKIEDLHLNTFNEIVLAAKHFLKPDLLNKIRMYLTTARMIEYEISETIQDLVQNEFVSLRQKDPSICADDLHGLLVLARLICISNGKKVLDEESWKKACSLEESRKKRLKTPNAVTPE